MFLFITILRTVFLTYVKNMLNYVTLAQQLGLMEWFANLILLPWKGETIQSCLVQKEFLAHRFSIPRSSKQKNWRILTDYALALVQSIVSNIHYAHHRFYFPITNDMESCHWNNL